MDIELASGNVIQSSDRTRTEDGTRAHSAPLGQSAAERNLQSAILDLVSGNGKRGLNECTPVVRVGMVGDFSIRLENTTLLQVLGAHKNP